MKRVAEKLELLMHGLSDLDSMRRSSAATKGSAVAASASSDLESERRMMGVERPVC